MDLGPILRRELTTSSRRPATYRNRAGAAAFVPLAVGANALLWWYMGRERASVTGSWRFGLESFGFVAAIQALLLIAILDEIPRSIAVERERKTLDALLASGLSSAGIVLGVLVAGLIRSGAWLFAGLPAVLLFVPLMGVDPRLILLAYLGIGATGFAMAAIAVIASAGSRNVREAAGRAATLWGAWMFLPFFAVVSLPILWPAGRGWLVPPFLPFFDSSPLGVAASASGIVGRGDLSAALPRMVAYELAGGVVLVLWAIARLRPASRALADAEARTFLLRRLRRPRRRRRPACGDDPMLWKELHATPGLRGIDQGILWSLLGFLGLGIIYFARPAFAELVEWGYGPSTTGGYPTIGGVDWAVVLARGVIPTPVTARAIFNMVLREVTLILTLIHLMGLGEAAAKGVAGERDQDTWPGLLVTPLSGREILRAKRLGAIWKTRRIPFTLVGFWTIGLAAGAVHPLGFLAASIALAASTGLVASLGTAQALRAPTTGQSTERTLLPVVLMLFSGMIPRIVPSAFASVLLGAGSLPLLCWFALLSYDDVAAALRAGTYPQLAVMGIETGEGAGRILATYAIGVVAQATAGVLLARWAERRFDRVRNPVGPARIEPPRDRMPCPMVPSPTKVMPAIANPARGHDNGDDAGSPEARRRGRGRVPRSIDPAGGGRR